MYSYQVRSISVMYIVFEFLRKQTETDRPTKTISALAAWLACM